MNDTPMRSAACQTALRLLDSHITSAPLSPGAEQILKHFEECPDCARELAIRNRISARLKQAVDNEPEAPYLEAKIRRRIERYENERRSRWTWSRRLLPVCAGVVVCLGLWISYQLGHLRMTTASQESYIASISGRISRVARAGLGDHVHCTVFRKLPNEAPSTEAMLGELGPDYGGLLPVVRKQVSDEYRVVMAHRCTYHARKFVHITLVSSSKLLSLVITRKGAGESFRSGELAPALAQSGIPIYETGVQRFSIAGFESREHLVYVVSDLNERQNLEMMAGLAGPVHEFLKKLEA